MLLFACVCLENEGKSEKSKKSKCEVAIGFFCKRKKDRRQKREKTRKRSCARIQYHFTILTFCLEEGGGGRGGSLGKTKHANVTLYEITFLSTQTQI